LLDQLYAAATEPGEWPAFIEGVAKYTDSALVSIHIHDVSRLTGFGLWQYGLPEGAQQEYAEWAPHNPQMIAAAPLLRTGRVFPNLVVPKRDLRNSAFHVDWLDRYVRTGDNAGLCIFLEPPLTAVLACNRTLNKPDYGPETAQFFHALRPHLQRAVSVYRRLGALDIERAASVEALERLSVAVFFIDERGKVLFYNDAANRLLTQRDGIVLTGLQRLGAVRSGDDAEVQRLVREACAMSSGAGERPGGVLQIRRPSNRRPYAMIIAPLGLRQWPFLSERPAAAVFVSDPEHTVQPPAEHLARLFGLTPAEARLAAALAARLSLEDYAEQAKITIGTARWTLKRVLEKTGCRRQSELVHILVTSVAGIVRG